MPTTYGLMMPLDNQAGIGILKENLGALYRAFLFDSISFSIHFNSHVVKTSRHNNQCKPGFQIPTYSVIFYFPFPQQILHKCHCTIVRQKLRVQ